MEIPVNYLAVFVAAVAQMVLGAIWYAPFFLGKPWMALIGKTPDELKKGDPKPAYLGSFVCALVMAYVLAHLVVLFGTIDVRDGIEMGLWLGIGIAAAAGLPEYLFMKKPFKLFLINWGYQVAGIVLMSAILSVWQ